MDTGGRVRGSGGRAKGYISSVTQDRISVAQCHAVVILIL